MATTHVVGISDCKVSADPNDAVATYALGSCVGVALYDPVARVGGILHIMLPDSQCRASTLKFNPFMFADSGFQAFLRRVMAQGAQRERLGARLAGGANMLQHSNYLDIGRRNAEAVISILEQERIPILGQSLRGACGRSMFLRIGDGQVTVRLLGLGEERI